MFTDRYPCLPVGCRCLSSVSLWPPRPLEGDLVRFLGLLELLTPMDARRWPCRDGPISITVNRHVCVCVSQHKSELSTCAGLGLGAALLGRIKGSDPVMVLSLLARSRGWEWREGGGSVWTLSFSLGTNFGDSKKGTDVVAWWGKGYNNGPGSKV